MYDNVSKRLLSDKEVDADYGISRRFLQHARLKGEGPKFVKVGRLIRYRRCHIEAWIDALTQDTE